MRDFAHSTNPDVQAQLNRLAALSLPTGRLGLEVIASLLARLGNPHLAIPPAFHVAGTNGKGSTCAFLRSMLEAAGYKVHSAISPHLVRYNERIRLAGRLIDDELLAATLCEVLDAGHDLGPSFFEATIAASFLAFSRIPADLCVVEVGLGGRFDATNIMPAPLACAIAELGLDHERFLLAPEPGTPTSPLARIAFEKSGIAKPGAPLIVQDYSEEASEQIRQSAARAQAPLFMHGVQWRAWVADGHLHYEDDAGTLTLPRPVLHGTYQARNAALAVALLRHQNRFYVSPEAMAKGICATLWPARMQQLAQGPLTSLLPDATIWLDGGHNAQAASGLATTLANMASVDLVIGMLTNRNIDAFLAPLAPFLRHVVAVPVPGHDAHAPAIIAATAQKLGIASGTAPNVAQALRMLPPRPNHQVLIAGSLYLAGRVLEKNEQIPD